MKGIEGAISFIIGVISFIVASILSNYQINNYSKYQSTKRPGKNKKGKRLKHGIKITSNCTICNHYLNHFLNKIS